MTYYLARDREDEVRARVEYLYRVFHPHFLRCADIGDFLCLKSFPFQDDGICFVTAHNNQAHALLSTGLKAETVVLNSCFPKQFKEFTEKYCPGCSSYLFCGGESILACKAFNKFLNEKQ